MKNILCVLKQRAKASYNSRYLLPFQSTDTGFCHLLSDVLIMNKKIPLLKFEAQET